jgi:hypothetical protein
MPLWLYGLRHVDYVMWMPGQYLCLGNELCPANYTQMGWGICAPPTFNPLTKIQGCDLTVTGECPFTALSNKKISQIKSG